MIVQDEFGDSYRMRKRSSDTPAAFPGIAPCPGRSPRSGWVFAGLMAEYKHGDPRVLNDLTVQDNTRVIIVLVLLVFVNLGSVFAKLNISTLHTQPALSLSPPSGLLIANVPCSAFDNPA